MQTNMQINIDSINSRGFLPHTQLDNRLLVDKNSRNYQALLSVAVGDAYGEPIEFKTGNQLPIYQTGALLCDYKGKITDDTQLTLFTLEGINDFLSEQSNFKIDSFEAASSMNNKVTKSVAKAYQRWLMTQDESSIFQECAGDNSGLVMIPELNESVNPGMTLISALKDMEYSGQVAFNYSQGSGCTTKNLPIAMLYQMMQANAEAKNTDNSYLRFAAFELGFKVAQLTHGHPMAKLVAGAIATIQFLGLSSVAQVSDLSGKNSLANSLMLTELLVAESREQIKALAYDITNKEIDELLGLLNIDAYAKLNGCNEPHSPHKFSKRFGEGWVASETFSIAVYCALNANSYEELLNMSAIHDGDSDSTCSLASSLFSVSNQESKIPEELLDKLETKEIIEAMLTSPRQAS
ncbi:hypothetical protein GCM10009128_26250 [Psychrosphaera haliotis]|uniref:ADP-ribosylglycohydrolase family protein n=1 Tax=Psychrosphaera haliotis TaxID=555083 RepID=UPI0031DEB33D